MLTPCQAQEFDVQLTLYAAGPIRPRTKYKEHKTLQAERCINLPFVPYPGLYLTMERPRKRGQPLTLYLRVRAVEWVMAKQRFACVVDEILGSSIFDETFEIRGGWRNEQHFRDLEKALRVFGFEVDTVAGGDLALDKHADGSWIVPPEQLPGRR